MDHFGESLENSNTIRNGDCGCLAHESSEGRRVYQELGLGHSCDILSEILFVDRDGSEV